MSDSDSIYIYPLPKVLKIVMLKAEGFAVMILSAPVCLKKMHIFPAALLFLVLSVHQERQTQLCSPTLKLVTPTLIKW